MSLRHDILLLLACFPGCAVAVGANRVDTIPPLAKADSWRVRAGDEKNLTLSESGGYLGVRFAYAKHEQARLELVQPLAIPDWATDFTFLNVCHYVPNTSFGLWPVIRDGSGKEFLFHTDEPRGRTRHSLGPGSNLVRVHVPGLKRPEITSNPTVTAPGTTPPQRPYTLVGFQFTGLVRDPKYPAPIDVFLRDFQFASLSPLESPLFYQFRDREFYGETDPQPWLSWGEFGWTWGRKLALSWEARDRYDGPARLAGGDTLVLGNDQPQALQLGRRIELPIREVGTWWVRARVSWFKTDSAVPDQIKEFEYRLYIPRGEAPTRHAPLPVADTAPNALVRVLPERTSVIFTPTEPFAVSATFYQPPGGAAGLTARLAVSRGHERAAVRRTETAPDWADGKPYGLNLDLSDQPPGVYYVTAELIRDGKALDRAERLIGRRAESATLATVAPIPPSVPSARDLWAREKPMFHLEPRVPPYEHLARYQPDKSKWDLLLPFLEAAPAVSHELQYPLHWSEVEPLPGVYDWSEIDRVIELAATKGMTVLLCPNIHSRQPEWLPSQYTQTEDGHCTVTVNGVFRDGPWLHNALFNFAHAPEVGRPVEEFMAAVAARYRGHAALQGYLICFEFAGTCPPTWGWRDGFEPATRADFSDYCRTRWHDLATLNRRWGSAYTEWQAIAPPPTTASARCRLDWLQFQATRHTDFMFRLAEAVRQHDDRRVILYDTSFFDAPAAFARLKQLGGMTANGGSTATTWAMPHIQALSLEGIQERTEEISVGRWSAMYPTQLDASLFAMTLGGGGNTHCRMFIDLGKPFAELRQPPYSLDRYETFMPIWTELRATETVPFDCFLYQNVAGRLLAGNTIAAADSRDSWAVMSATQSHLTFASGAPAHWERGKLLLLTAREDTDAIELPELERIVRYAEKGGTVVMRAMAGRRSPDLPGEDWILLRRFGFATPADAREGGYATAVPVPGTVFPGGAQSFVLRETLTVPLPANAETLAFYDGKPDRPAISWRPVGQGRVAVIWASTLVPPTASKSFNATYPFLADVARWAGCRQYWDSAEPLFWANLLKNKQKNTWYGLVIHFIGHGTSDVVTDTVRFPLLPDGRYRVSERISGKDGGVLDAAELRTKGIRTTLGMNEVAIWRLEGERE